MSEDNQVHITNWKTALQGAESQVSMDTDINPSVIHKLPLFLRELLLSFDTRVNESASVHYVMLENPRFSFSG